jgi:hypothetical protein
LLVSNSNTQSSCQAVELGPDLRRLLFTVLDPATQARGIVTVREGVHQVVDSTLR